MKTLSILILFFVPVLLFTDTLYLSNSNVVKGTIKSIDDDVVKIETADGILEVSRSKIVRGEFFGEGDELSGNLVLEFLFDGNIKDSSGNAYPVKTKSIPYTVGINDDESGAIESKGEGQYFYIENSESISDIDSFTIAMNYYPEDTSSNTFLISNWENTFADRKAEGRFSISVLNNNIVFFVVDSNGYYQTLVASDKLILKAWNTVAVGFDSGEMSIFLNGETVARNTISEVRLLKGDWPIYILTAKYGSDFNKYNIKGKLDNFKMFDNSLSDEEIKLLYPTMK